MASGEFFLYYCTYFLFLTFGLEHDLVGPNFWGSHKPCKAAKVKQMRKESSNFDFTNRILNIQYELFDLHLMVKIH